MICPFETIKVYLTFHHQLIKNNQISYEHNPVHQGLYEVHNSIY